MGCYGSVNIPFSYPIFSSRLVSSRRRRSRRRRRRIFFFLRAIGLGIGSVRAIEIYFIFFSIDITKRTMIRRVLCGEGERKSRVEGASFLLNIRSFFSFFFFSSISFRGEYFINRIHLLRYTEILALELRNHSSSRVILPRATKYFTYFVSFARISRYRITFERIPRVHNKSKKV